MYTDNNAILLSVQLSVLRDRERGERENFFFIDIIWFFSDTHAKPVPYEYQQYQGSFLFIKNKELVNALVLSYPKDNLS